MMISIRRIISPFVLAGILMVGIMTRKIVSNILLPCISLFSYAFRKLVMALVLMEGILITTTILRKPMIKFQEKEGCF